jgi:hypothetical protein
MADDEAEKEINQRNFGQSFAQAFGDEHSALLLAVPTRKPLWNYNS